MLQRWPWALSLFVHGTLAFLLWVRFFPLPIHQTIDVGLVSGVVLRGTSKNHGQTHHKTHKKVPSKEAAPLKKRVPPKKVPPQKSLSHAQNKEHRAPHKALSLSSPKLSLKSRQKAKKRHEMSFESVLKTVKTLPSSSPTQKTSPLKTQGKLSLAGQFSSGELDALRQQIASCWNVPVGARHAQDLRVKVHILVRANKTVKKATAVPDPLRAQDPFWRAASESAVRALLNPHCSPLELPDGKYNLWKDIVFTFDPREMFGG